MSDQANMSQASEVPNPADETASIDGGVVARNDFGRKLLGIRDRAIQKGMRLKSLDEILADTAEARKES